MSDCTFTQVTMHSHRLAACPCCGHTAELWELVDEHGVFKFACCGRGQEGALGLDDGCPLSNPPRRSFYMPTLHQAAQCWNDFAARATRAARDVYMAVPDPQQVLKAEAATPDATDRGEPDSSSPSVGSMGAGQPADAGPTGGPHTEGPWEVIRAHEMSPGMSWIQIGQAGGAAEVCIVRYVARHGCEARAWANARLLAEAPELKKALGQMLRAGRFSSRPPSTVMEAERQLDDVRKAAQYAFGVLARVEGLKL